MNINELVGCTIISFEIESHEKESTKVRVLAKTKSGEKTFFVAFICGSSSNVGGFCGDNEYKYELVAK